MNKSNTGTGRGKIILHALAQSDITMNRCIKKCVKVVVHDRAKLGDHPLWFNEEVQEQTLGVIQPSV